MAKEIKKTITIPEGVTVTMQGRLLSVTGPKGKIERNFWYPDVKVEVVGSEVIVDSTVMKKTQKAMVGTFASHITNMVKGVTEGFEYRMKVVYSHFPMQIKVEGDRLMIGNFLGEKKPRSAKILGETKVKASGDEVVVTGNNKEDVGQTAANIEQTTRIKRFDPRVFQDGIYTVEKIV
ncbi:LSU ribosomal protein L6P [Methanolobus vulcani]|jgi:large subunit ribosomal protein L6|uniref:Large ribosomal subunit protein uL6 n=1 Tax=Methanolobus vulcani TaxID=38026 RepID=A0A7Z7AY83_9EURY|nr:50S ribosomal protein L6 [Methanolobus vulcani]MDK2825398.1 large subunit ribosomal protein [Methanolobus sp.]SDF65013.1 LSU ribosomal protein L6P [Methanolobus vulcani]